MLRILIIALLVCPFISFGQSEDVTPNNNVLIGLENLGKNRASFGFPSFIKKTKNPIEGTVYIYDEWSNTATVSSEETKLRLNNMNFNALRNAFQSKIGKDSIFTFNFRNIKDVVVNNTSFKNIFSPIHEKNRVFEVLEENKDFSIYKDYRIEIKVGSPNPQAGSQNDKYLLRYDYYVKQGENFDKFSLKKSKLLKVMGDKATEVGAYIKSNKLKVKNPEDFSKIMTYYKSL